MADPVGQLISRERPRISSFIYQGGVWFFNLSLVLLILALILFGGLFFYGRTIEASRADWAREVTKRKEAFGAEGGVGRLVSTSNSLGVVRELVGQHVFASNVFAFLAEVTHPKMQFNSFAFARDSRKIDLSGLAANYKTVAEQVNILESHPQVEKVEFGGLATTERGFVSFRLAIIFKPSLLNLRVASPGVNETGQ